MQRIVLLTSIIPPTPICLLPCSPDYIPNLEGIFRNKFRNSRYEIEIVHYADQSQLYSVLHHPRNIAVFWLSHATAGSNPQTGNIFNSQKIIDAHGYDVTPVFAKVHPNLKVLAVIGCHSKGVAEKFTQSENLHILSFEGTIEPRHGLQKAIDQAQTILNNPTLFSGYPAQCKIAPYYQLKVWRDFRNPSNLQIDPTKIIRPAARIMAHGTVVGVFPPAQKSTLYQFTKILIPVTPKLLPDLRLDMGENAKMLMKKSKQLSVEQLNLGRLRPFLENYTERELWSIWQRDGKPIGLFSNTYLLNRSLLEGVTLEPNINNTTEFISEPMPPY